MTNQNAVPEYPQSSGVGASPLGGAEAVPDSARLPEDRLWAITNNSYWNADMVARAAEDHAWRARDAEIQELKERIQELEND